MSFSVIIPCQNAKGFLALLLDDIAAQTLLPAEVIICDNNSSDGSVAEIQNKKDSFNFLLRIIPFATNIGFTGAVNYGERESSYEFNIVLNADLRLEKDFFARIAEGLEDNIDIYGVRVKSFDGKNIESEGLYLTDFLRAKNADNSEKAWGPAGAAFAFRKKFLQKYKRCNLLDNDFFFLWEDVELACFLKFNTIPFKIIVNAVCYHYGNSGARNYFNRQKRSYQNRKRIIAKYYPHYRKNNLKAFIFYDIPRALMMLVFNPYREEIFRSIKKSLLH